MKELLYFFMAVALWMAVQIEIDSYNPCSNFSNRPEQCSSDRIRHQ